MHLNAPSARRRFECVSRRRGQWAAFSAAVLAALAGCGGSGDDGDDGDAAALKSRLLPASELSAQKLHRTFEWDDPIDLVVQGLPLSETTAPSGAVEVMEEAGFTGGAGENLRARDLSSDMGVIVASFASEEDAREVQAYMYREGLKLPCYGSCTQDPSAMSVSGIPGAKGIQQLPNTGAQTSPPPAPPEGTSPGEIPPPPTEHPPFVAYHVGFTIGKDFYLVHGGGEPGKFEKTVILDAARKQYQRVSAGSAS
jgi:hypothetical protein